MSSYTLEISKVQKMGAFNEYLTANLPFYDGFTQTGTTFIITTKTVLSIEEHQLLLDKIADYNDPEYWMQLANVEDLLLATNPVASVDMYVFTSFINSYRMVNETVCDSIKSIVQITTNSVEQFANYVPDTNTDTVTLQIFDYTRGIVISEITRSMQPSFSYFKEQANNGYTGVSKHYSSVQFYGLKNSMPNYDCIWQLRASRSTNYQDVAISFQGFQKLFYYINNT
jgi:hypothetical protein